MATGSMKNYYKQKKSGIGKSPSKPKSKPTNKSPAISSSLGSDLAQPTVLIAHGSPDLKDEFGEDEEVLRQFDLNMAYGPCLGMSRLDRWERANSLGLNPPKVVESLLRGGKTGVDCLWDGRV
uniref:DNA polymerase delta subunit 4 n=1 Tax=Nelumbo nucifera TaxID=4432 RepID=A0A822Y139_NELNU|nr:TPA_asm: hypothetical protein HUJ06_026453 [Nelumbo nucifera]